MESKSYFHSVSTVVKAISTVLGLGVDEIDTLAGDSTFVKLGGDSVAAILVAAECRKGGISIPANVFLRESTLKDAIVKAESSAQFLYMHPTALSIPTPAPLLPSRDLLGRINATEWTEPQLLLLRETANDQKRNILTIHKAYTGEWDAHLVCNVWTSTILAEPIFRDVIIDLDIPPHHLLPRKIIQVETEEDFKRELQNAVLVNGSLCHLTVVQLASSSVAVVWRVHHSFMDGFSARILHDKISRNLLGGELTASPGPSFKDTVRALGRLRDERGQATRRFWDNKREQFSSAVGKLCLNPQRVHGGLASQRCITIQFPEADLAAARARTGYTTTVYFAAAWALTLGKFMDTDQVYFGMAFSGRDLPILGAFDVVGPLINILPLFVQLPLVGDRETSARAFLRRIQEGILGLSDVQHSDTTDGFDRQFTSIIATQFEECEGAEKSPPVDPNRPDMQSGIPLSLVIQGQSRLQVFYSTADYSEEDMNNVWSVFRNGMNCFLQDDDDRPLVPAIQHGLMPREMEQTIRQWSNCESFEALDDSKGDDLVTLFESVVARQPTAVAITRGHGQDVSYDDFDKAAAAVARELSWVEPNEPVCVYATRSIYWLVAIFGVLKVGGVYTPLDPSAPVSVRHANFVRSGARAILFPSSGSISADTTPLNCLTIAVDNLVDKSKTEARQDHLAISYPRRRIARPDDLAYICFTSGSSGQPKAVQCTHKGLVAFQKDYSVRLAAKKGTVVAQVMSPVFDGSIHEIFSALTHGATLRLASADTQDHPLAHLQDCDSAILTPSIANALDADQYPRLRNVYLVGEAVPQSVSDAWARNRCVYNMYGPTEATCGATIKQLAPSKPVTLGQANPSSRVYVLDRNHHLLPPGAAGELYIAGIQVSNGYINLPSENANRFLSDSILPKAGQRMYKTGDYGYRDSMTGEIYFIGRKDRQIKLRGFRLDLDDLELRITKAIPNCRGAAIFRREDYLVAAYQIPSNSTNAVGELEAKILISHALPPYAMPRRILALFDLPLTAAGKLDYKKLEQIDSTSVVRLQSQQKSMTETEMMIVRAVRDLMRLDSSITIDRDSDLTALGGHSIVQLRLASRISSFIQRKFTVRNVIDNPVISHLASSVDEVMNGEVAVDQDGWAQPSCLGSSRAGAAFEDTIVSPIEAVWFSRYQQNLGTSSFNVAHVSELDDCFDQHSALVSSWTKVLARHSILRCRFRPSITAHEGVERFYAAEPPEAFYVESFDLRAAINTEFSLETEHPIRVLVSKRHMLVCVSHIICDYSTLERLFEEFAAAYYHDDRVEASLLASQRCYQDSSWCNVDVDQITAKFWRSYLSGIDVKRLPPYMKRARTSHHGESRMFQLSKDAVHSLETISTSLHLTMHQVALGTVSLVLQADSLDKQDLILGSPYLGRQEEDMHTIGLFLQPLPIRVPRRSKMGESLGDAHVEDFLHAVQDSARSALGHGIGWTSLMDVLSLSDDENLRSAVPVPNPNHPLFDAMVTFHERSATGKASSFANGAIAGVEPLITWAEGAKFGIMFEFSAVSSSVVTLRIEYDTSVFSADEVLVMAGRIDAGLEYLCQYMASSMTVRDVEDRLLHADGTVPGRNRVKGVEFGTRLATLV
ncbi:hypothetical protein M406DRAFT_253009 [Cryphonectria parasitica EP155]|uniref:Carrier domain-containing protein n=1 Tax=Cryphonectria parasitica (strain ATCC 38755 / EP155) TaxID=660469 RepID=A0A9P5CSC5_CRYP1|nr:uncharacterized protein M406DRAFT_253009 [Cryphonectria parasitica EP155]KAF3768171.1 hypothetical protein M406DRAFT_253009 [Cryphonectria parasitica EP155]